MAEAAIELSGVWKSFRIPSVRRDTVREHVFDLFRPRPTDALDVLRDVNVTNRRGESVGIMGRNGCGKSTLLKIVAGIYQADRGSVVVRDAITPVLELGVGFNPELDAIDNVFLLGTVMGLSLAQVRARLDGILRFAELERFARQKLQHYSSGMVARLAYAVAFSSVRDVLILDEIFAVGDASFQARCEERYIELVASGRTVLLVTHDPATVANLCDRAILVEQGAVIADGDAGEVADDYVDLLTASNAA
jgi:ABC-type polysaccharide/polyol phosphate transport system ATPase subunit